MYSRVWTLGDTCFKPFWATLIFCQWEHSCLIIFCPLIPLPQNTLFSQIKCVFEIFSSLMIKVWTEKRKRHRGESQKSADIHRSFYSHTVGMAAACPYGVKIYFMRNPTSGSAPRFFVIVLKFLLTHTDSVDNISPRQRGS